MYESVLETIQRALVPCLISTGGLTSLCQLEMHGEFNVSKRDDA